MHRREFLRFASVLPGIAAPRRQAAFQEERVERLTAPAKPALAMNHLGFLVKGRKPVIYRLNGDAAPVDFELRDIAPYPKSFTVRRPFKKVTSDFGDCAVGEFTDVEREAMYQVNAAGERSVPFFLRNDLWRRTLPKAVGYIRQQRCGTDVPNVHKVCHLDDARRRDNGERVDTVGGWHDAGDLRKWMSATMTNGMALCYMARHLGEDWDLAGAGLAPVREEAEWGNRYFLKMQDSDGRVFADVAGGVNGDNSDNHWTDNTIGTADDRFLNPSKSGRNQAMFTLLQALITQLFRGADDEYAARCLKAAESCWAANSRGGGVLDQAWWALAGLELHRAAKDEKYKTAAAGHGAQLIAFQYGEFIGSQKRVRGFFRTSSSDASPFVDAVYSAKPAFALLELALAYPDHPDARRWRDAVRLYLDEYVTPMVAMTPYQIMPLGVFRGESTPERYRPLEGELTYRYFLPVRKQSWWLGTTSHLESHALLLASAAKAFEKPEYRALAYRQLDWVMGGNPFGACLMTGEGMRNPYPHSRYVGLIIGGIMNGIAGNVQDEPILDMEYGYDWRTTEYWSPHNAHYIWALSVLESGGKA